MEALHSLGISPTEQEVVDMQCEVEKKGRIFFPDFCKLCLRKFREFDEENFRQELFKVRILAWSGICRGRVVGSGLVAIILILYP